MSKRKHHRRSKAPTARQRALAAVRAGDAREAERWSRIADRLGEPAPEAADETPEEREKILRTIAEKIADFRRGEEEREAVARDYDRFWWEAGWNEIRTEAGLDPLPIAPPLYDGYIRWAQAHPKVDFWKRTLRRYRERGYLPPEDGEEAVTEE